MGQNQLIDSLFCSLKRSGCADQIESGQVDSGVARVSTAPFKKDLMIWDKIS
jgi:hypothetical protein